MTLDVDLKPSSSAREITINEDAFFASRSDRLADNGEIKRGAYLCAAIDGNGQTVSVIKHQLAKFPSGTGKRQAEACSRCNLKWKAMLSHYTVACALINLLLLSETCN